MNKEYLTKYEEQEKEQIDRFISQRIKSGSFLDENTYPPKERFLNIQEPIANTTFESQRNGRFWAQVPFCGSLMFSIQPMPKSDFEKYYLNVKDIPDLIDFVKDTGRIQIVLSSNPTHYIGLDYLDPIFKELKPPCPARAPLSLFLTKKEIKHTYAAYDSLAAPRFYKFCALEAKGGNGLYYLRYRKLVAHTRYTYSFVKKFEPLIAEEIENKMVDNPLEALFLLNTVEKLMVMPRSYMIGGQINLTMEDINPREMFQHEIELKDLKFPYEIGTFLMKKLTYAPNNLRACNDMIDHYEKYDLEKVQKSLNDAVIAKEPKLIIEKANELSTILDNVWNDKKIQNLTKAVKLYMNISIAVGGFLIAGRTGLLAALGVEIMKEIADSQVGSISEKIVKKIARPYYSSIYDFKEKYNLPKE